MARTAPVRASIAINAPWLDGAVGKAARIVATRCLRNPGQRRRLGDIEVAYRLAEVALRRRLDAVGAAAEVDLVEVQLEDLVLRETGFDVAGDLRLLQLARERLLPR